jgi:hypothetical protein
MSIYSRSKMRHLLWVMSESRGLDEGVSAKDLAGAIGAVFEEAFIPRQGLTDAEDIRREHKDLSDMSIEGLRREIYRAQTVIAWGDDRTGWANARLAACVKELARRPKNGVS